MRVLKVFVLIGIIAAAVFSQTKDTLVVKDTVFLVGQESKRRIWLGTNFQNYYSSFPRINNEIYNLLPENMSNKTFNLEIGYTKENETFTFLGIIDIGQVANAFKGNLLDREYADDGLFGGGVFLGRTTNKIAIKDYFRFSGGWDIGYWVMNFRGESYSWAPIQKRVMSLGGPHLKFIAGYKKIFLAASFKTYFGFKYDYIPGDDFLQSIINDRINDFTGGLGLGIGEKWDLNKMDEDYNYAGFAAIFTWNIGVTVLF